MPLRRPVEPTPEILAQIEGDKWYRASGDCVCEACGKLYYDHPDIEGYRWLILICNGDLIKY